MDIKKLLISFFIITLSACGGGGGSAKSSSDPGNAANNDDGVITIANAAEYPWTIDSVLLLGDNLCQLVANGGITDRADYLASAQINRHIEGNCAADRQLSAIDLSTALLSLSIALPAYTDIAIFLGLNDYLNNVDLQTYSDAYAAALDAIQAEGINAHCLIQPSLTDHPDFNYYRQAAINICTSRSIIAVDTSAYGLTADYSDNVHFSATMHQTLADILASMFAR